MGMLRGAQSMAGVLAIAGDDHGAKSSTLPHQSDHNFISAFIPYLYPSGVSDIVPYGLLGYSNESVQWMLDRNEGSIRCG